LVNNLHHLGLLLQFSAEVGVASARRHLKQPQTTASE